MDGIRIYTLKSGSVSASPSNVQLFHVPRMPATEIF